MRVFLLAAALLMLNLQPAFSQTSSNEGRSLDELFAALEFDSESELKQKIEPTLELKAEPEPVVIETVEPVVAVKEEPLDLTELQEMSEEDERERTRKMLEERMRSLSGSLSRMPQPPRLENKEIDIPVNGAPASS